MSRYEQLAQDQEQGDGRKWDRYGLYYAEWEALTAEQREAHYNRHRKGCEHPYEYKGIETEPGVFVKSEEWGLREQYSFDPYAHTSHMFPCRRKDDPKCDCQMCTQKIGIEKTARP